MNAKRKKLMSEVDSFLIKVRRYELFVQIALVLGGAAAAGIGRLREISWLTFTGIGCAFLGGILIFLLKRDVAELVRQADAAIEDDEEKELRIARLEKNYARLENQSSIQDERRRNRLLAHKEMLETLEAAFMSKAPAEKAAEQMLLRSFTQLRGAIDYEKDDNLSISIFQKVQLNEVEIMQRIAAESTTTHWKSDNPRAWPKGEGYTGVCWQRAENNKMIDIIIEDTSAPGITEEFPVKQSKPERDEEYRSVVSIPILIGKNDDVWGIVTATSSRINAFRRDPDNLQVQNIDTIRDVARHASLLAAL